MNTDTPPSDLTRLVLNMPGILPQTIWAVFSTIEHGDTLMVQGAVCYASGAGVLPFQISKNRNRP